MKFNKVYLYFLITVTMCIFSKNVESRSVQYQGSGSNIRSDVIVTKWPENEEEKDENEPGWMRQQLMKFGKVASRVGNAMGAHATKITSAVDKVCEIVKTIVPLLAAICHVGQFTFCSATSEAPQQLTEALSPTTLDLNVPDKK